MKKLPMVSDQRQVPLQRGSSILRPYSKESPRTISATNTSRTARYSAENMVAYQPGKAAKIAAPATISHTSFPSQTGPIVLMHTRRSASVLPTNECSIPTPKSKPSRTKNPTQRMAMMMNQTLLRYTMAASSPSSPSR